MIVRDVGDHGFVFLGWALPSGINAAGWGRTTHLGLPFILFCMTGPGVDVNCRIDPCGHAAAMVPYAAMARRDLLHELAKATRP